MNYKVFAIRFVRRLRQTSIYHLIKKVKFLLLSPFITNRLSMDYEDARNILNSYRPNPNSSSIHENIIAPEPLYDLTVVVPCYNVAPYVGDCVKSILNQETSYKYKVILIDDGSIDDTRMIIDCFSGNRDVTIIHQQNNGLSNARNQGIYHIESKYITFVDADDCLVPEAIQKLLETAYAENADIVEGSHYRMYNEKVVPSVKHDSVVVNDNYEDFIGMPWGKVFRSTLFQNVIFPEKLLFEDSICSFLLYPAASKNVTISDYVYVYRIVSNSITHSSGKKVQSIDTIWITELMLKEHEELKLDRGEKYSSLCIKQIVLNYYRMKKLPKEIQRAAFIVTCEIFGKYCQSLNFTLEEDYLVRSLKELDYGKYKLFCETRCN